MLPTKEIQEYIELKGIPKDLPKKIFSDYLKYESEDNVVWHLTNLYYDILLYGESLGIKWYVDLRTLDTSPAKEKHLFKIPILRLEGLIKNGITKCISECLNNLVFQCHYAALHFGFSLPKAFEIVHKVRLGITPQEVGRIECEGL